MCRTPPLSIALMATALLSACDPGVGREIHPLEVRAPTAGDVWVDGHFAAIDALTPARFELQNPPPYTVTFMGADGPLTVIDVPGPVVDLGFFVDGADPLRGRLIDLDVRTVDGDAELAAVVDRQVFRPIRNGEAWRFTVPDTAGLTLIGLWRQDGRATHLTRRVIARPDLAVGRTLVLGPEDALEGALPIGLEDGPRGILTAELTEAGLHTGLILGTGALGPGEAVILPRPAASEMGVWVRLVDGAAGAAPRRSSEAALPLSGEGAVLNWSPAPTVQPQARGAETPAWFDAAQRRWSIEGADDADWIEATIDGRGDCVGRPWRIIAPPGSTLTVPTAVGLDPLRAPIVDARFDVVRIAGTTRDTLLETGPSALGTPGLLITRRAAAVRGWWRTDAADCPVDDLRGYYVVEDADTCSAAEPAPYALVSRCGALALLDGEAGAIGCGHFEDDLFVADDIGPLSVEATPERITVDDGRLTLFGQSDPEARPPGAVVGDWARYELFRQPVNEAGQALSEPVRVDAGAERVVTTVSEDGLIEVRTPLWALDAKLSEVDAERATARVVGASCAARPATLDIRWAAQRIELIGNAPDGDRGRRWTLILSR